MRHVLLFIPRLVCAITCVSVIMIAAPVLLVLGERRAKETL